MVSRRILALIIGVVLLGSAGVATFVLVLSSKLPKIVTVEDYHPLLVSEVYDVNEKKIGEFYRQKRTVVPYSEIPEKLVQAFISAEDSSFFDHGGINYVAIFRALIANLKAGRKVQGGSTITQQVARSLLLTPEKTYIRKVREVLLAYRMEANLSKEDILYLYLNQIYLGGGAYGVAAAADIYFRKELKDMKVEEMAILAGLPQAPSRYSPVGNPSSAKARQKYVLQRMAEEDYITEEESEAAINAPVKVYLRKNYKELAPYYVETVRKYLVSALGEEAVLDKGIKVYTPMNLEHQLAAQKSLKKGLRDVDKRQGYRGAKSNLTEPKDIAEFLLKTRNNLMDDKNPLRIINPDGTVDPKGPLDLVRKTDQPNLPEYIKEGEIADGIVTRVDDKWGLTTVRFAEAQGLIDMDTMKWAGPPNPDVRFDFREIDKPSKALKVGDVVQVKIIKDKFRSIRINKDIIQLKRKLKKKYKRPEELPEFEKYVQLELEQEPITQGALISFDIKHENVTAMIGGYDFVKSEFNRALQALRQSGSSFKPIVYTAALDKGYKPNSTITDAPVVFDKEPLEEDLEGQNGNVDPEKWKPGNYSSKFGGDILLRNALRKSKNIPTIKVSDDIGVEWVSQYARRLGLFSPLNMDLSLGLGSSSITLYEITKVFAHLARLGKSISPIFISKVVSKDGDVLIENVSLDMRFEEQIKPIRDKFEKMRLQALGQEPEEDSDGNPIASKNTEAEAMDSENQNLETKEEIPALKKFPPFFFNDPNQLISKQTAYLMTSLLKAVVHEPGGTGGRARALGYPTAAKTGTTNGYFDAWFVGYTPHVSTGVWVGYDEEKSLGVGEVGGRAALPIWLEYMKVAHEGLPKNDFPVPENIVFANIDNETGYLASASSKDVVRQAFLDGTEPQANQESAAPEDNNVDFYKQDLSE